MKVLKYKNNYHIFLPTDVAEKMNIQEGDEVDFFEIKPSNFVILKREVVGEIIKKGLNINDTPEKQVNFFEYLKNKFKENERTPYNLRKILTKEQLNELNKYITDGKIKVVRDENNNMVYKFEEKDVNGCEQDWQYMVLDINSAAEISKKYEKLIKNGEIIGVRGFDKLFYVAKTEYYNRMNEKIKKIIVKNARQLDEIAVETGESKNACNAILQILLSNGEIMEQKKGLFILA